MNALRAQNRQLQAERDQHAVNLRAMTDAYHVMQNSNRQLQISLINMGAAYNQAERRARETLQRITRPG